jgi:hypothetical protein
MMAKRGVHTLEEAFIRYLEEAVDHTASKPSPPVTEIAASISLAVGQETPAAEALNGLDGRGKGDMAKLLKVKPADLTQLSAKHDGFFPFWDVYRAIDGRKEIWGHGPRDMPIWGTVFKQEAGPDRGADLQAYARMLEIVYYIESIQAPARRSR